MSSLTARDVLDIAIEYTDGFSQPMLDFLAAVGKEDKELGEYIEEKLEDNEII